MHGAREAGGGLRIEGNIGRHPGDRRRMTVLSSDGKPAVTRARVLERFAAASLVECRLETGRTHQIRVHAAHVNHPIAGDDKYGDPDANRRLREKAGLKRLALHAASLEFALDSGRRPYLLNAPLPPDLVAVLDRL